MIWEKENELYELDSMKSSKTSSFSTLTKEEEAYN